MLAAGSYALLGVAGAFQRGHLRLGVDGTYISMLSMVYVFVRCVCPSRVSKRHLESL